MGITAILNNANAVPVSGQLGLGYNPKDDRYGQLGLAKYPEPICNNIWSGGGSSCDDPVFVTQTVANATPLQKTIRDEPAATVVPVTPTAPAEDDDLLFGVIKTKTALIIGGAAAALFLLTQSGSTATRTVKAGPATGGLSA
jgi:hypothetical protein